MNQETKKQSTHSSPVPIAIERDLHFALKVEAAKQGKSLKALVEPALQALITHKE